jgi:hypothetical protein
VIAYVTNGIRVMVLVVDPRPEIQESHTAQGILMFLVGTLALSVDRALLRLLRPEPGAGPAVGARRVARADERRGSAGIALAFWGWRQRRSGSRASPQAPPLPPAPSFRVSSPAGASESFTALRTISGACTSQSSSLVYERGDQSISAFLGWDDHRHESEACCRTRMPSRAPDG